MAPARKATIIPITPAEAVDAAGHFIKAVESLLA